MGKKSGAKVKESANEKALAEVSKAKWDRYKTLYRGVEQDFIEKSQQDTSKLLGGRAIADVAQASAGGTRQAVALGRGSVAQLGATAENIGGARSLAKVGANKAAQELKDKGGLNALAIGLDMQGDAQSGLATAARASQTEALGKARAQQIKNEATSQMIGMIAGGAAAGAPDISKAYGNYKAQKLAADGGSNYVRDVMRG